MRPATKLKKQVKNWTITFEVEHYTDHESYIDTVTAETRVGRYVNEANARMAFWSGLTSGVTPNGVFMENVKGIRILHAEGTE